MLLRCANSECLREIEVSDSEAGVQVECPFCGFVFYVPTSTEIEAEAGPSGNRAPEVATVMIARQDLDEDPFIGRIIGGARILRKLGEGGMGSVYLARHDGLDIHVATKILPERLAEANPTFIRRFRKEARAAARLDHRNVVKVMNVGEEHGVHFLIMEYVEGQTLKQRLEERGRPGPDFALHVMRQVLQALGAAHALGILHRDLKPSNIFLKPISGEGDPVVAKLGDFGLAKFEAVKDTTTGKAGKTVPGAVLGSPHYMSPEQAQNASQVDARSDLYSAGCVFYQVLTGQLPFDGSSLLEIVYQHCTAELPELEQFCPEAPSGLFGIIRKMTAKSVEDRFASAEEVLEAIDRLDQGPATTGAVIVPPEQPVSLPVPPYAYVSQPFDAQTTTDLARCPNPKCRFPISDDSEWCEFCGAWILRECPGCGAKATKRRSYCRRCGGCLFIERDVVEQLNRGDALLKEKRFSLAIGAANSILRNDPTNPKARQLLEQATEALGQIEQLRAKATAAVRAGEHERALALLEEALEIDPDDEELKAELEVLPRYAARRDARRKIEQAQEAKSTGSLGHAQTLFREALEADPANRDAEEGLHDCQELLKEVGDLEASFRQFWESGELDKAAAACERILEQNPTNSEVRAQQDSVLSHIGKARECARKAEGAEAKRRWERAAELWRQAHQYWTGSAEIEAGLERAEKMVEELHRLLAIARDRFSKRRLTSGLKRLRHVLTVGETPEAQALLEKHGPEWKRAEDRRASAANLVRQRLWRRAAAELQEAHDLNHQAVDEETLSDVRSRARQLEKMVRESRELLDQGRFGTTAEHAERGLKVGADPELQELAEEARRLQERVDDLSIRALELADQPGELISVLSELLRLQPYRKDLRPRVTALRKKVGQPDTALEHREDPSDPPTEIEDADG